jgi:hypothetical protein
MHGWTIRILLVLATLGLGILSCPAPADQNVLVTGWSEGHEPLAPTIHFAPPLVKRWTSPPNDYYPDASRRAHETGEVILHFRIGADGIAQEPLVVDDATSAVPRLIEEAEKLFRSTRYETDERYRHEVTASVLFEIMPCGKLKATAGLDYYLSLCVPAFVPVEMSVRTF